MQRKKGSNWIEMVIKMVNKFKLTVVHFARPNPMQICACAWIYRWTKRLWKIRTGPPGLRAAGPWRAVGLRPLCRGSAFSKTRAGFSAGLGLFWAEVPPRPTRFYRSIPCLSVTENPRIFHMSIHDLQTFPAKFSCGHTTDFYLGQTRNSL